MDGESGDASCDEEGAGVDAVDLDDCGLDVDEDSEEPDDDPDEVVSSPVPRSKTRKKAGRGGGGACEKKEKNVM